MTDKATQADFAREVWKTLSTLNVNDKTERKGNLTYLSWAWAWQSLLEHYPESTVDSVSENARADGTMTITVTVTVRSGDNAITRSMWLPVMGNRNEAVQNPDARKISDATMRCLTKCLGMFGLGLYIYAGEDLPDGEAPQQQQRPNPDAVLIQQWQKDIAGIASAAMATSVYRDIIALKAAPQTIDLLKNTLWQKAKSLGYGWDKNQNCFTEKAA